jgi:hypothetical protein
VSFVRFTPNGRFLLANTLDNSLRIWGTATHPASRCLKTYRFGLVWIGLAVVTFVSSWRHGLKKKKKWLIGWLDEWLGRWGGGGRGDVRNETILLLPLLLLLLLLLLLFLLFTIQELWGSDRLTTSVDAPSIRTLIFSDFVFFLLRFSSFFISTRGHSNERFCVTSAISCWDQVAGLSDVINPIFIYYY